MATADRKVFFLKSRKSENEKNDHLHQVNFKMHVAVKRGSQIRVNKSVEPDDGVFNSFVPGVCYHILVDFEGCKQLGLYLGALMYKSNWNLI